MPRNSQGVWSPPLGTRATPNTVIQSGAYNGFVDESESLANEARPITAGGTGAATAEGARANLGISPDVFVARSGSRMAGSLSSAIKDHGSLGAVTEEFKYADANTHKVTVTGAFTINPTGLSEGDVMQINVLYSSGTIAVSGTTQWEIGGGAKTTDLSRLGIVLTAGVAYRIIFEMVAGIRTGVFQ